MVGSIDQKYLEQIVQDFNKTINGEKEKEIQQSSSVIFDDPIDIGEPELNEITTQVFQNESSNYWEGIDMSDEFLADVEVVYHGRNHTNINLPVFRLLFMIFLIFLM